MPRKLRAVPDLPPGAVLYVRQSVTRRVKDAEGRATSELDTVSPEIQEAAGREHCTRHGYRIIDTIVDLNRTGRTLKRRQVQAAIGYVERGDAQVIVVWKWSRLARNRRDFAVTCDLIESLGGRVESSTEPIDTTTAVGRFNRGVLAEFAAFESDRAGEIIKEVYASRAKRGLPGNGKPRFGYVNTGRGHFQPDPELGPVLASMYRQYLAGGGYQTIARWLNDHGHKTTYGGHWRAEVVRSVLDSGFGAGLFRHRGQLHPGTHKPVISMQEWDRYIQARDRRSTLPPRTKGSRWLLAGLTKCGLCGSGLQVRTDRRKVPWYVCRGRILGTCINGYVKVATVEGEVLRWLAGIVDDVDKAAAAAREVQEQTVTHRHHAETLARRIREKDDALTRLTVDRASGLVPEQAYAAARDEIMSVRQRLAAEHADVVTRTATTAQVDVAAYRGLLTEWPTLTVAARREMLQRLLRKILVWGRPFRLQCIPAWAGDDPQPPGLGEDLQTIRVRLLRDLRTVFGDATALYTRTIIDRLCNLDDRWSHFEGRRINPHDLGRLLAAADVTSVNVREPTNGPTRKGYRRADLTPVWDADSV